MSSILKISEAASLALHAMIILAENTDKLVSVKEIAEELDVSANHLSKVLQRLVKYELVVSIKGAKGGFKLAKDPEQVTFLEIYEAIEGNLKEGDCLLNKQSCNNKNCVMNPLLKSVKHQVKEFFENKKLSDFVK